MQIIKPHIEIMTPLNKTEIYKHIERCGRTCYKSEDRITKDSAVKFIKMIVERGHWSVLEHYSITVKFVCSRATATQLLRHRIASYSMESTRYCDYSKDKFKHGITFIEPNKDIRKDSRAYDAWKNHCINTEVTYLNLRSLGIVSEDARDVLLLGTKTELIRTANIRSWMETLQTRIGPTVSEQTRELCVDLLKQLQKALPEIFNVIKIGG
jgi:thymidylate synthase (FAD)